MNRARIGIAALAVGLLAAPAAAQPCVVAPAPRPVEARCCSDAAAAGKKVVVLEARWAKVPAGLCEKALACGTPHVGFQTLTECEVRAFLQAAQACKESCVTQTPRVTVADGEEATVRVGGTKTYVTGLTATAVHGTPVLVPQTTNVEVGDALALRPHVSADGKFVRLQVQATRSIAGETELIPVTTQIKPVFEGGSQGVPIPFTQFVQAPPAVSHQRVQVTAVVPVGGTVALRGWREPSQPCCEPCPVLSEIPYVNRLFKPAPARPCDVVLLVTAREVLAPPCCPGAPCPTAGVKDAPCPPAVCPASPCPAPVAQVLPCPAPACPPQVVVPSPAFGVTYHPAPLPAPPVAAAVRFATPTPPALPAPIAAPPMPVRMIVPPPLPMVAPARMPAPGTAIVYKLRNVAAADVAQAVTKQIGCEQQGVVVIAEPVSNNLIVRTDAGRQQKVAKLLGAIDQEPPSIGVTTLVLEVPAGFVTKAGLEADGCQHPESKWVLTEREARMLTALIRAEKQTGIEVLSRPQICVSDNQTGFVQVGQDFPVQVAQAAAPGQLTYQPVGFTGRVTPRVMPDGKSVLLRVETQVSRPTPAPVNLGNGVAAQAFNVQTVSTAETIPFGGTLVVRGLKTCEADGKSTEVLVIMTPTRGCPMPASCEAQPTACPTPMPQR
jgi:type II secretory pathway component GspD/PulD (secretin)